MKKVSRYIIRASFSWKRRGRLPEESKVVYGPKEDKDDKVFDALGWLASMISHVPDKE